MNPSNFISSSGDTCKDARLFPLFGSSIGVVPSSQTLLSGTIHSSMSTMTYEFWMKDMKIPGSMGLNSVILENTDGFN